VNSFDLLIVEDEDVNDIGTIFVKVSLDGKSYQFQLDTGSNQTILLEDDYLAAYETIATHESVGAFSTHQMESLIVSSIKMGPISKKDFELSLMNDETDSFTNQYTRS